MTLQGRLESFPLTDIARLLALQGQTGKLSLDSTDGEVAIYFDSGRIISGSEPHSAGSDPLNAVVAAMRKGKGSFQFTPDSTPEESHAALAVESVLVEAEFHTAEWAEIEAVIPSLDDAIATVSDVAAPSVTLNADQWGIVVAMARGTTVREIAASMSISNLEAARGVKNLIDMGLAEVVEMSDTVLDAPPATPVRSGETDNGSAREALSEMVSGLDRRLADLGPPPGVPERRKSAAIGEDAARDSRPVA